MNLNGVEIEDTFAEAFPIKISRVIITAATKRWAITAATEATGFGTSVIACPAEAGIEKILTNSETPDGRPGASIFICHGSAKEMDVQLLNRIGQCVLTAPTCAVFNGLPNAEKLINTGFKLRFFADGFETQDTIAGRKVWRIPMMQGEFIIEENLAWQPGIAGGNFFIMGKNQMAALNAAEVAVDAIASVDNVITPFTGGIVASGSKVGANKYKFLRASMNEKFAPTLKTKVEGTQVPADVEAVYEIVINGLDLESLKKATKVGIEAAVKIPGIVKITAGNFGGKLGPFQIKLAELF